MERRSSYLYLEKKIQENRKRSDLRKFHKNVKKLSAEFGYYKSLVNISTYLCKFQEVGGYVVQAVRKKGQNICVLFERTPGPFVRSFQSLLLKLDLEK